MDTPNFGGTPAHIDVFIDTSLKTHLAVSVSDTDTASDLKKKILHEHPLCFPSVGNIKISALKIKRRGCFYHLSDSFFLKRANNGATKCLFLYVDATRAEGDENQRFLQLGFGKKVISSANGVHLLDSPKRLSHTGDMSFPVVESEAIKYKSTSQPLGTSSSLKVSEDSKKDSGHNAGSYLDSSLPGTYTRSGEDVAVDHDKISTAVKNNIHILDPDSVGKVDDLAPNIVSTDSNSKTDTKDVLGKVALKEAPQSEAIEKRRHKTKRKTRSLDAHTLEENDGVIHASALPSDAVDLVNALGNVDQVSVEAEGNKDIASEPLERATSDGMKQSNTEEENANFQGKMTGAVGEAIQRENDVNVQNNGKSLEEASPPQPSAKKKHKMVKKPSKESSSTGYAGLNFDSNKETPWSEVNANQRTTDSLVVNHGLTASPSTGKRKKKKKFSKDINQIVAPVSSSAKDPLDKSAMAPPVRTHEKDLGGEPDEAIVPGGEERDGMLPTISPQEKLGDPINEAIEKETETGSMDVDDMGGRKDASTASGNPHVTDVVSNPDLVVQEFKKLEDIRDQIDVLNDDNGTPTHQPSSVEEEEQLSKNINQEAMANRVGGEIKADGAKSVKSSKSKKKSRKTKNPVESTQVTPNIQQVEGSEVHKSLTETVKAVDGEEHNIVIRNVLESLQQSNENQEKSEKVGEKSRKKTKRKRNSNEVDVEESWAAEGPKFSTDNLKEVADPSKSSKKAKRAKISATKQLSETKSKFENIIGIDSDALHTKQNLVLAGSLQDMSHKPNDKDEGETTQNIAQGLFEGDLAGEPSNQIKIPHGKERMNVDDNFDSRRNRHYTVANGELLDQVVNDTRAAEARPKTEKNKKMTVLHPSDPANVARGSVKSYGKQGGRKAQPASSRTSQQPSKSTGDHVLSQSKRDVQRTSESKTNSHSSGKIVKSSGAQKLGTLHVSGTRSHPTKKKEAPVGSDSSFVSHREIIQPKDNADTLGSHMDQSRPSAKGVFMNKNGEVVKRSHSSVIRASGDNNQKVVYDSDRAKSLPMSGSIFKDNDNWDSEDDGADTSDASTRTPSDVASDYSDEDSVATSMSLQIGSNGKENGGKNTTNLSSSGPKDISLEKILRSSSRYKKAKLVASQSQRDHLDDDSLPFECVPDSLPH